MITVAVPTRDRFSRLERFINSFDDTTDRNKTNFQFFVVHDSPTQSESVRFTHRLMEHRPYFNHIVMKNKSSLAELWNYCIAFSDTDWVLVCNDDAVFKPGWHEYLIDKIREGNHLQINLLHYGGFCIHKKMILRNGWFDERFRGGGFEDNDWQLRLYEGNLKGLVDISHDFKLMDHLKYSDGTNWLGVNNESWILKKWGRNSLWNWRIPSFRKEGEIDWHPAFTKRYEDKYQESSQIRTINERVGSQREIYH